MSMIKLKVRVLMIVAAAILSVASTVAGAADKTAIDVMKPFILASTGVGTVSDTVVGVKKSLIDNGFIIAGEYSPYEAAHIIVVTNKMLKKMAASHKRAGYAAGQRVAVTKVGDQVQVTYTNPAYMAAAYHVKGKVSVVSASLKKALGSIKEYGPKKGMSAKKLNGYHYTFGMEYFDEPYALATYDNYRQAIAAVEKGLAKKKGGVTKVYRIDIPGAKQTLFGVAMSSEKTGNKFMDDGFIMTEIDFKDVRSTAHLPYEILVTGDEVEALHARFRIAVNFPDLSMMGANSFMNIMPTPDAIQESLTHAAGGELEEDY
jgi:uncharacterized protein (DUF302 family)